MGLRSMWRGWGCIAEGGGWSVSRGVAKVFYRDAVMSMSVLMSVLML